MVGAKANLKMKANNNFKVGEWVTGNCDWGKADGIADELSVNTAYEVIGKMENGFLMLRYFILPVNPIYLRASTKKEINESIEKYSKLCKNCGRDCSHVGRDVEACCNWCMNNTDIQKTLCKKNK